MQLQTQESATAHLSAEERFERTLADVLRRIRARPKSDERVNIRSTGR